MGKEVDIPIKFSVRTTPEQVKELLGDHLTFIFLSSIVTPMFGGKGELRVLPSDPCVLITGYEVNDELGYIAHADIPNSYEEYFAIFRNPVIHPIIYSDENGNHITVFRVLDICQLYQDRIYDGIHYPDNKCDGCDETVKMWNPPPSHPSQIIERNDHNERKE